MAQKTATVDPKSAKNNRQIAVEDSAYLREEDGDIWVNSSHPLAITGVDGIDALGYDPFEQQFYVRVKVRNDEVPAQVFDKIREENYAVDHIRKTETETDEWGLSTHVFEVYVFQQWKPPRYHVKCRSPTCDENTIAKDVSGTEAREIYDEHDCDDGLKQLVPVAEEAA